MVKPAGARCNLHCDYCFFLRKKALYPHSPLHMSPAVMEKYIKQMLRVHQNTVASIAWQGGEPTLMGVDFFKNMVKLQKKYATPSSTVENSLQTNGILIDEEWGSFLSENKFLVGLSLDGPKACHDAFRRDKKGNSVFEKVVQAVKMMKKFQVNFNILCTINSANCSKPLELYRFFRDELDVQYLQFIPIVERANETDFQKSDCLSERTVPALEYGNFLIAIFDEWVKRDVGKMFIQFFEGVLASYVYGYSSLCVLQPTCGQCVALEHNGDLYSCDHYVEPDYLLGNIMQSPIEKLVHSEQQHSFGKAKSLGLPSKCKACEFLFTCYGECPKNRIVDASDGSGKLNWLCDGLKNFFSHTKEPMKRMASLIRSKHDAAEIMDGNR